METQDRQPPKPRRWPWIGLAILLGVPALAILALQAVFTLRAIPRERMAPPADAVRLKPPAAAARIRLDTSDQTKAVSQYVEFVKARHADSPAVAIYEKWIPRTDSDPFREEFRELFDDWLSNRPLSAQQTEWLIRQRELVEDLLRLAAAADTPMIGFEDALACDQDQLRRLQFPALNFNARGARILIAESRRRRDAGDPDGAVEAIEAVTRLGQSFGRPLLWNQQYGAKLRTLAFDAYGYWIEDSMPPETARRVRENLLGYTPADIRLNLETEYRRRRAEFIADLSRPYNTILENQLHHAGYAGDLDPVHVAADMNANYQNTVGFFTRAAWKSIKIKSGASKFLDEFDANYREMTQKITPGEPLRILAFPTDLFQSAGTQGYPVIKLWEALYGSIAEENTALARRNLDLAALERMLGGAAEYKDPFTEKPIGSAEEGKAVAIYSIGPDARDDHARIVYDPTNGTCSAGDIILRLANQ
ncbi:MAG: hypothetical protein ABFD69_10650 [Candidatus Sumerlaeia bacterium]